MPCSLSLLTTSFFWCLYFLSNAFKPFDGLLPIQCLLSCRFIMISGLFECISCEPSRGLITIPMYRGVVVSQPIKASCIFWDVSWCGATSAGFSKILSICCCPIESRKAICTSLSNVLCTCLILEALQLGFLFAECICYLVLTPPLQAHIQFVLPRPKGNTVSSIRTVLKSNYSKKVECISDTSNQESPSILPVLLGRPIYLFFVLRVLVGMQHDKRYLFFSCLGNSPTTVLEGFSCREPEWLSRGAGNLPAAVHWPEKPCSCRASWTCYAPNSADCKSCALLSH